MSLRSKLNDSPAIPVIGVLIALGVCGYFIWSMVMGPRAGALTDWNAFYTIDDGKTVFGDTHPPSEPFQKDGKDAYLAIVFTCDNNKTTFVGYIMKREPMPVKFKGAPPDAKRMTNFIKKPGDAEWVSETNMGKWTQIERSVKCPQGQEPIMVTPKGMAIQATRKGAKGPAK